ncbi:MAG TPA: hypothetical protein VFV34_24520 [Blastocatellia bacterium]|nr:hypothetical protein [Blastocatellia bacterium]
MRKRVSRCRVVASAISMTLMLPGMVWGSVQSPTAQSEKTNKEKQTENGLSLIMDVLNAADSLQSVNNRIYVYKEAAGILAEKDPALATQLFNKALENIKAASDAIGKDNLQRAERLAELRQMRNEVILGLSDLDPIRALEVLKAERSGQPSQPPEGRTTVYMTASTAGSMMPVSVDRQVDSDDGITGQIIANVARKNADLALDFATRQLGRGVTEDIVQAYVGLRDSDPKLARSLARDIVARLKTEKPGPDSKSGDAAMSFLATLQQKTDQHGQFTVDTSFLDKNSLTDLVNYVADNILAQEQPSGFWTLGMANPFIGVIQQYAPSKAARLTEMLTKAKAAVDSFMPGAASAMTEMSELPEVLAAGNYDRALQIANKMPDSIREEALSQVVERMLEEGQIARAREFIGAEVKNAERRDRFLDRVASSEAEQAADKGDEETTKRLLPRLSSSEQRVSLLISLAKAAEKKGDKGKAVAILQQAEAIPLIKQEQLSNQLLIIKAYVTLKPDRAVEMLKAFVDKLNTLLGAAAVIDGYVYPEFLQDGEYSYTGASPLVGITDSAAGVIATLAKVNFEEARAIARRFDRPEIEAFVELSVAESMFEEDDSDHSDPPSIRHGMRRSVPLRLRQPGRSGD